MCVGLCSRCINPLARVQEGYCTWLVCVYVYYESTCLLKLFTIISTGFMPKSGDFPSCRFLQKHFFQNFLFSLSRLMHVHLLGAHVTTVPHVVPTQ